MKSASLDGEAVQTVILLRVNTKPAILLRIPSSRQSPLALPHNPGGQRFANSCDVESVVSLNASELPGPTGPLVSARDDPRRAAFSLIHSKNLVTVLVGDDAVPVYRRGDAINKVVRNCANHLGFVEETIGNVIEE